MAVHSFSTKRTNPTDVEAVERIKKYCEQNGLKIYGFLENLIKEKCRVKTDIYGDPLD